MRKAISSSQTKTDSGFSFDQTVIWARPCSLLAKNPSLHSKFKEGFLQLQLVDSSDREMILHRVS